VEAEISPITPVPGFMGAFAPVSCAPLDSAAQFATTHWTLILTSQGGSPQASQALERLCGAYWPPLYAFVRRRGYPPEEAQDLTQGFFARLLQKNDLAQVKPGLGKFRSYLLASLKHYLANEWDAGQTRKRGGGQVRLAWDDETLERQYQLEAADQATPETIFERRWALNVLEHALIRLREEYLNSGKRDLFEELKGFLSGDKSLIPQGEIAAKLGTSVNAVRVGVHRMRQRYGQLLREQIAATVSSPAEIEEEIRHLMTVLGR
jgi:RNA polymerase sigma-70 factor (ECF subfamily)